MSDVRSQYWQEIVDLKVHALYISQYRRSLEKIDRNFECAIALISTAALGGWAWLKAWEYAFSAVIVLSQLASVVKRYLPYGTRLKAVTEIGWELDFLAIEAEDAWHKIQSGSLTSSQINDLRTKTKKKKLEAEKRHFAKITLPEDKELFGQAEASAAKYFKSYHSA